MSILTPLWMQNGTYPARYDRLLLQRIFGDREMVFEGLAVQQHTPSAAVSVDVTAGACTIIGDDQTDQGLYLVYIDARATLTMPAVPGSNKRIDGIDLRINDPQAGGPSGNNATLVATQGTASATPVAPAVPSSAIRLATVLRTAGDAAILTAQITATQGAGKYPYTISSASVPALLPPNYLYIRTA